MKKGGETKGIHHRSMKKSSERSYNTPSLLIMRPHPQHFYYPFTFKDLIDNPMLYGNSAGVSTGKVANQLFVRRGILERVVPEYFDEWLYFFPEPGRGALFCIFLSLLCIDQFIARRYHLSSLLHFSTGVAIPSLIDSRIPGIDSR